MGKFKLPRQILFLIPVAAIVAVPAALYFKNNTTEHVAEDPHAINDDSHNTKKSFSMPEPFASEDAFGITYPMRKSMDPGTWMQMMTAIMNPRETSPEAMCTLCHQEKDVMRYQQQFGSIMQPTWNQYKAMMDPHVMGAIMNPALMTQMMHQITAIPMQMMMPMTHGWPGTNPAPGMALQPNSSGITQNIMSPEQYEAWYNEQQKKSSQNR